MRTYEEFGYGRLRSGLRVIRRSGLTVEAASFRAKGVWGGGVGVLKDHQHCALTGPCPTSGFRGHGMSDGHRQIGTRVRACGLHPV